jgi:linoleoyl-CoA desaturase
MFPIFHLKLIFNQVKAKTQVRFVNKDKNLFFPTLKKRVDAYFKDRNLSKNANNVLILKTIILTAVYVLPFGALLWFQPSLSSSLILWFIMGIGVAGLGMSVMHDACHGAYSSNESVNYWIGGIYLNMLGGSTFNWNLQHNVMHHMYTNVVHLDEDINDKLVLKFSPHTPIKIFHQFQWLYAFLFYGILTLYWVTLKDFVNFITFTNNGVNTNTKAQNVVTLSKIIFAKIVYFCVFFCVPTLLFGIPFQEILIGFLLMHFVGGIILTTIFQLAHSVEGTTHPLPNEKGVIENDWAIHQMNTTVNFSRQNKWLSWYVGGLNFQVEHHLFPKISHVHYPQLSEIVKQTAEEFDIPYLENPTFGQALRSHITNLHQLGRLPDFNEAFG